MNESLTRRIAALTGLALAAAVAAWWLGSTHVAIDHGADPGRSSAEALQIAWLARAMLVPAFTVRVGALRGWRSGAVAALALVVPSWPLVAVAWSASTASMVSVVVAESCLIVGAIALPALGHGLRRLVPRSELAEVLASVLGIVIAAAASLAMPAWPFAAVT
jgi:hypothetical protein